MSDDFLYCTTQRCHNLEIKIEMSIQFQLLKSKAGSAIPNLFYLFSLHPRLLAHIHHMFKEKQEQQLWQISCQDSSHGF